MATHGVVKIHPGHPLVPARPAALDPAFFFAIAAQLPGGRRLSDRQIVAEWSVPAALPKVRENDHACHCRVSTPQRCERVPLYRHYDQQNNQISRPKMIMSLIFETKSEPHVAITYTTATAVLFVAGLMYTMLFPLTNTCRG